MIFSVPAIVPMPNFCNANDNCEVATPGRATNGWERCGECPVTRQTGYRLEIFQKSRPQGRDIKKNDRRDEVIFIFPQTLLTGRF